ncbi:uncharacterized protein [Amphiura filiformis]|uniref:uncharacterized protein n=1 Tax=Amphiura filiformis TaxID=82378 RepID=UPI003B20ECE3
MAVIKSCCCCGIRSGSTASAVYSIIIAIMGAAYFGYRASRTGATEDAVESKGYHDLDALVKAFLILYYAGVIIFIFTIVAAVFVFIGIGQDSKGMLVPFVVAKGLHLLWYVVFGIVDLYWLISLRNVTALGYFYLLTIILVIPFFIADLMCFLCVISQYQEYSDGRGKSSDRSTTQYQPAPTTATYVVQQQAMPTVQQQAMPTAPPPQFQQGPGVVYYASPPPPPYYKQ